jgi:hypothetical protein
MIPVIRKRRQRLVEPRKTAGISIAESVELESIVLVLRGVETMPNPLELDENLIQAIREAFSMAAYPGDDLLVYDTSGAHLECIQVAEAFRGRHWPDVSVDQLLNQPDSLFFFTPEAYRYYLPAFMIAAVQSYVDMDIVVINLVHTLIPPAEGQDRNRFEARMQGLNARQRSAVRQFLEFLISAHGQDFPRNDLQLALETYWA